MTPGKRKKFLIKLLIRVFHSHNLQDNLVQEVIKYMQYDKYNGKMSFSK